MNSLLPLSVVVAAYTSEPAPWNKRKAVKCIVADRMASQNARGKGYKAARRAARLGEAVGAYCREINRQIALKRANRAYDVMAEFGCESRAFYDRYRHRTNFHE